MLRFATPLLLFLSAFSFRILSWHSVFQPDGVYPNGNDAYYHLRRIRYTIEHFPDVLRFDPLMNHPLGAQPIWSPVFDWLFAALLRPLPGIEEGERLAAYSAWIPPLLGAMTVVLLYFVGCRFYSRAVGVVAATSLVFLPAHVLYSRLGNVDHHVLVALLSTIMLALAMELFRTAGSAADRLAPAARGLGLCIGLGLAIGGVVLVWPGALLHVGIVQIAMVARLLTERDRRSATRWGWRFALTHVVAGIVVYPLSAGNEWTLWGTRSPVVLSDFQPLYFFSGAITLGATSALWRFEALARNRSRRMLSAGTAGLAIGAAVFSMFPDLFVGIDDALSWFTRDEDFQSLVSESQPLVSSRSGLDRAFALLSPLMLGMPIAVALLARRLRDRPEQLLFLGWTFAFFVSTLVQWRFMNTYSIAQSLLLGIAIQAWVEHSSAVLPGRTAAWRIGAIAIPLLMISFAKPLQIFMPHYQNVYRSLRGEPTRPVGALLRNHHVTQAARFLRDFSPPPEQESYSVLAPWGYGHLLKYIAHRPVAQDGFGDDVAPENFVRARAYFAAETESEALGWLAPMEARYVLALASGSGRPETPSPDSLLRRLFELRGSRGRPSGPTGHRLPVVSALTRHRLVYQCEPLGAGQRRPFCLLYEVVEGAEIVGRAEPGAIVRAQLLIRPELGQPFEYVSQTVADTQGRYALRVPYANELLTTHVRTGDRYAIAAGARAGTVFVPESAVRAGDRVKGPSFVD